MIIAPKYLALCLLIAIGGTATAAEVATLTQGDFNASQRAYEEIRQANTDISRAARTIQEVNATMWERILELEKQNAQLYEELATYKNMIKGIQNTLVAPAGNTR